eukprot:5196819-Pleurochrysis_carterae.AAC.1
MSHVHESKCNGGHTCARSGVRCGVGLRGDSVEIVGVDGEPAVERVRRARVAHVPCRRQHAH